MSKLCKYPNWESPEGGMLIGEHHWDKDGFCNICGQKKNEHRCVYCDCLITYEGTCESCGKKEDMALGKLGEPI